MSKTFLFTSLVLASLCAPSVQGMEKEHNSISSVFQNYTDQNKTEKYTNLEHLFKYLKDNTSGLITALSAAYQDLKNGNFRSFDAVYGGNSCQIIALFCDTIRRNEYKNFSELPAEIQKTLMVLFLTADSNIFDKNQNVIDSRKENFLKFKDLKFPKGCGNLESRLPLIRKCAGECITNFAQNSFKTTAFKNKNGIMRVPAVDGVNYLLHYAKENKLPVYLKLIQNGNPIIMRFNPLFLSGSILKKNPQEFGLLVRAHLKSNDISYILHNFEALFMAEAQKDDNEKIRENPITKSPYFEVRHITGTHNPFELI